MVVLQMSWKIVEKRGIMISAAAYGENIVFCHRCLLSAYFNVIDGARWPLLNQRIMIHIGSSNCLCNKQNVKNYHVMKCQFRLHSRRWQGSSGSNFRIIQDDTLPPIPFSYIKWSISPWLEFNLGKRTWELLLRHCSAQRLHEHMWTGHPLTLS